jgi:hypothetical protein
MEDEDFDPGYTTDLSRFIIFLPLSTKPWSANDIPYGALLNMTGFLYTSIMLSNSGLYIASIL